MTSEQNDGTGTFILRINKLIRQFDKFSYPNYASAALIGAAFGVIYQGAARFLLVLYPDDQVIKAIEEIGFLPVSSLFFITYLIIHWIMYYIPTFVRHQLSAIEYSFNSGVLSEADKDKISRDFSLYIVRDLRRGVPSSLPTRRITLPNTRSQFFREKLQSDEGDR
jgi:hypothetical protein